MSSVYLVKMRIDICRDIVLRPLIYRFSLSILLFICIPSSSAGFQLGVLACIVVVWYAVMIVASSSH